MPKSRPYTLASLALVAALSTVALAGSSLAQPPPPARDAAKAAPRQAMRAEFQQRIAARRAERNKDLATVLRLRPDQMPALEAFVASQAPQRRAGQPAPGARPGQGGLTTPQRLDREAQRGQAMAAFMQRRATGLRTFYAALNPEQQQVFDALTRLRDSHGGRRGGHGMRMGRGRGPGMMAHGRLASPPPPPAR